MAQGLKAGVLTRGNGCPLHEDCFTCPGPPDCVWPVDGDVLAKRRALEQWLPYFRNKQMKVASK